MAKIEKVKISNFQDIKLVKIHMEITWKQYDLLKNALIDYSKKISNRDMSELLNLVIG